MDLDGFSRMKKHQPLKPKFIVDFPIKNRDFPWQNVSSPEGNDMRPDIFIPSIPWKSAPHQCSETNDGTTGIFRATESFGC